jgi:hypothetical protein
MTSAYITEGGVTSFSAAIALIVPLLIIAILVDSSRDVRRIGAVAKNESSDSLSVRQSRRTLLSIAVGGFVELNSLLSILTAPSDNSIQATDIDYAFVAVQGIGLLVMLYMLFISHVELHISNIRTDPSTARWSLVVGWTSDLLLLIAAIVTRFIGGSEAINYYASYIFFAFVLALTGSLLTLSITMSRRKRQPPAEEGRPSEVSVTPGNEVKENIHTEQPLPPENH